MAVSFHAQIWSRLKRQRELRMNGTGVAILGGIILAGINAMRFEQQREKQDEEIRHINKTVDELIVIGSENAANLKQQLSDLKVANALSGNWLPGNYRQLIVATVIVLSITAASGTYSGFFSMIFIFPMCSMRFVKHCLDIVAFFKKK